MQYLISLVFHFLTSNSRHGTHSPFVYKIANEVIYSKSKPTTLRLSKQRLLDDIASYFQVKYTRLTADLGIDKALIVSENVDIQQLITIQKEYKYIVVHDIYKSDFAIKLWKSICSDPHFIVCIDLFYFGLIFYREEQPKQLFKLRFPYWR